MQDIQLPTTLQWLIWSYVADCCADDKCLNSGELTDDVVNLVVYNTLILDGVKFPKLTSIEYGPWSKVVCLACSTTVRSYKSTNQSVG